MPTLFQRKAQEMGAMGVSDPYASWPHYYVRKNGNDTTGDGSTGNPWLTISKLFIALNSSGGWIANIGTGTYAENTASGHFQVSRNYTNPVIIRSETGNPDDVIVTGATDNSYDFWVGTSANVSNNITFKNITFGNRAGINSMVIRVVYTAKIEFLGCKILNTGSGQALNCYVSGSSTISNLTLTNCIIDSVGTGLQALGTNINVIGGSYKSTTSYAVLFGADSGVIADPISITGSIKNASIQNTGGNGHTILIGGHADSIEVSGCNVAGNLYTIIVKESTNCNIHDNNIVDNTVNGMGIYLKGSTGNLFTRNKITKTAAGYGAINLGPGDTANKCSGNTINYNTILCSGAAPLFYWVAAGDNGGNVCDYNVYTATVWGSVRGFAITDLTSLQAAWAGYGDGSNDSHSTAV